MRFSGERFITAGDVREYFQESVSAAISNQRIEAHEETVYYLVNLLSSFTRSERFYRCTPEGLELEPLALIYAEALEASSPDHRNRALRRLGDLALFIAGVFSESLNRKLVDMDYFVAMGGNAYGHLSEVARGSARARAFSGIFGELASKFQDFVDVLGEVSERGSLGSDKDIMRLYEIWVRTGSKRAARILRRHGIEPAAGSVSRLRH